MLTKFKVDAYQTLEGKKIISHPLQSVWQTVHLVVYIVSFIQFDPQILYEDLNQMHKWNHNPLVL
jgi:hypothetical protein